MSVQQRPDELIRLLRPEFAGRSGADSPASLTWGKIMLIPPAGAPVTTYPVTVAGLLDALAAATVAGSMIWVPPGSFNTAITIPANIALVALGEKVSINGQWTLNSGVVVANVVQTQSGSSTGALSGVVGPSSGIAYMKNCSITVENSGAGDAYAVNQSGAGELWLWGCSTYGNATGGGSGYGARQSSGTLYVSDDGRHRGSTGKFSGTVQLFSFDDVIRLKTSTFTKLFNATDAGLTAALAAASSGDTVRLPDKCNITSSPTVPSGVSVRGSGYNSAITGTVINNGHIEGIRVIGSVTNNSIFRYGWVRVTTGNGINQAGGFLGWVFVSMGTGVTYGINASGGRINSVHVGTDGGTNTGIFVDDATLADLEISNSRFAGFIGGKVERVNRITNCDFSGIPGSASSHGLIHETTGTARLSNCNFNGQSGGGYGLNVSDTGLTLTDCGWTSANGLDNITYGDGDRGAWNAIDYAAKHSKDLNDETYEHHWPLSNLTAIAAPTANDDSGDGYDVGSVWVDVTNDNAYICVDASVGAAVWEQISGGGGDVSVDAIWDAKGDLAVGTGPDTATRLPVGSDGDILTPDSGEAIGLKWEAPVDIGSDASGISKINADEQGSDPAAPGAGNRIIYPKSDGWYDRDSAGTVTGPFGAGGADEKSKVSANDTTAGYLNGKLVAGTNITLTENNDGGDETFTITATGGGTGITEDGWVASGETWTYASADDPTFTFTVSGDQTSKYSAGMRVRLSQSTGGTKYFIITKVAYSAPDTTITIYGGTDYNLENEAISSPNYSVVKAPHGFPLDPLKWTVETTDSSNRSQASPVQNTWYNLGSITISIPIGAWRVQYKANLQLADSVAALYVVQITLSTANNSESDAGFTGRMLAGSVDNLSQLTFNEKHLVLASKTSYFLNARTVTAGLDTLSIRGDAGTTIVRAVSAYL